MTKEVFLDLNERFPRFRGYVQKVADARKEAATRKSGSQVFGRPKGGATGTRSPGASPIKPKAKQASPTKYSSAPAAATELKLDSAAPTAAPAEYTFGEDTKLPLAVSQQPEDAAAPDKPQSQAPAVTKS